MPTPPGRKSQCSKTARIICRSAASCLHPCRNAENTFLRRKSSALWCHICGLVLKCAGHMSCNVLSSLRILVSKLNSTRSRNSSAHATRGTSGMGIGASDKPLPGRRAAASGQVYVLPARLARATFLRSLRFCPLSMICGNHFLFVTGRANASFVAPLVCKAYLGPHKSA